MDAVPELPLFWQLPQQLPQGHGARHISFQPALCTCLGFLAFAFEVSVSSSCPTCRLSQLRLLTLGLPARVQGPCSFTPTWV